MTLVRLKVERAVKASLCHGLERIGEFSEAVADSNLEISILFQKPPPIGKLPQAHCIPQDNLEGTLTF